ncbi:MAG: hypothetical protein J0H18_17405 [Rhizobiales bacterium]|nr:hypothetical protein [Hyphomicrobiales bacterium]OJY02017.1 MAG: hypothetical protein BGP07_14410 [Rhizobiales bacterium 63-22]
MMAEKFQRHYPQRSSDDGDHKIISALPAQMPAEPTPIGLFSTLMATMLKRLSATTRQSGPAQALRQMR